MRFDALMRRIPTLPHSVVARNLCVLGLLSAFSAAVPRAAAQGAEGLKSDAKSPPAAPAPNPPDKPATVGRNATKRDTREIQHFLMPGCLAPFEKGF